MSTELSKLNIMEVSISEYFSNDVRIIELKENIAKGVKESKEITVLTTESVNSASHYIAGFKKLGKSLETIRKATKDEILQKGKDIDSFFKELTNLYDAELTRLSNETLTWTKKQNEIARQKAEDERKAAEDLAIKEAIEKEDELKKLAVVQGKDPETVKVEIPIVPETVVETVKLSAKNTSGVHTRRQKTFEVVNLAAVPREYLMVDEAKVKAERNKYDFEAKSTIPGIEFKFNETL
jgi:hypothetical protein